MESRVQGNCRRNRRFTGTHKAPFLFDLSQRALLSERFPGFMSSRGKRESVQQTTTSTPRPTCRLKLSWQPYTNISQVFPDWVNLREELWQYPERLLRTRVFVVRCRLFSWPRRKRYHVRGLFAGGTSCKVQHIVWFVSFSPMSCVST